MLPHLHVILHDIYAFTLKINLMIFSNVIELTSIMAHRKDHDFIVRRSFYSSAYIHMSFSFTAIACLRSFLSTRFRTVGMSVPTPLETREKRERDNDTFFQMTLENKLQRSLSVKSLTATKPSITLTDHGHHPNANPSILHILIASHRRTRKSERK